MNRRRGQATVELALLLPFIAMLVAAALQVGAVGRDAVRVGHATRAAARAASIGESDGEVRRVALASSGLAPDRLTIATSRSATSVTVTVIYRCPTDVVLVGGLVGDVELREQLVLALER